VLYGIEALQVMRIEKGYLHIGTDTDGTTLRGCGVRAGQLSASWLTSSAGDRCRARRHAMRNARSWSGSSPSTGARCSPLAQQIAARPAPTLAEGRVTSSCVSPELGCPVALALLNGGSERLGERVRVHHLGHYRGTGGEDASLTPPAKRVNG